VTKKKVVKVVNTNLLSLTDGIKALKEFCNNKPRKFIESVDLVINLFIDTKQPSQNIRFSVCLPVSVGNDVRVIVFTDDSLLQKTAIDAGAIAAGCEDLIQKIEDGFLEFDYVVTTPECMKKISKIAKILGPKGLMPNPKDGNITKDVAKVVQEIKKGKIRIKNDKFGIVHIKVGKIDFSDDDLIKNINAVLNSIKEFKPESVKGKFIGDVYLKSTMSPSFLIDINR